MAEMSILKMRQCCKVMVNNSLIQPRGLSARCPNGLGEN